MRFYIAYSLLILLGSATAQASVTYDYGRYNPRTGAAHGFKLVYDQEKKACIKNIWKESHQKIDKTEIVQLSDCNGFIEAIKVRNQLGRSCKEGRKTIPATFFKRPRHIERHHNCICSVSQVEGFIENWKFDFKDQSLCREIFGEP